MGQRSFWLEAFFVRHHTDHDNVDGGENCDTSDDEHEGKYLGSSCSIFLQRKSHGWVPFFCLNGDFKNDKFKYTP